MSASASLIPELEDVIQHGSQERRATTLKRIANLFVDGAPHFNEDHIGLFDDVLCRLVVEIETKARAEMAHTLAPVAQRADRTDAAARPRRRHRGGRPGAHAVRRGCTRPSWSSSPGPRGRRICAVIAGREGIGEAVTDVLVRRGDPRSMRNVADNPVRQAVGGRLLRAGQARREATATWPKRSASGPIFRRICSAISWCAPPRWCSSACSQAAKPETQNEIQRVLDKVSKEFDNSAPARDYAAAQRAVEALHQAGALDEAELAEFANDRTVRGNGGGAGAAVRRADRDGGPADGAATGPIRS